MKRRWLALALALMLALACTAAASADAGGFSGDSDWGGWDSGSGSDWGSDSDWGSSSGSDWGSSSGGGWFWGGSLGDDDDYQSGGTTGGSGGGFGWIIGLVVVVAVIVLLSRRKGTAGQNDPTRAPIPQQGDLSALMAKDPHFSVEGFLEKAGNTYVEMQKAWEAKDWEPMRAYLSDALYNQMEKQLSMLVQNRQTNRMERIAVLSRVITRYAQDDANDILTCYLQVRLVDYTVSDDTGAVVSGSQTKEKFLAYEWTFTRSKDVTTPETAGATTQYNCKKCGAPLSINHTARCEYCGAVITATEHDWVLNNIRGLWQRTL